MSSASEELRQEGREEAREEIATQLLKIGKLSLEEIARVASLPLDAIKRIESENQQLA